MENIYHIATRSEWSNAKQVGEYYPSIPPECPFIHCCFGSQVIEIANFLLNGRHDLILLEINREKVDPDLKIESLDPNTELYPHLYRKLKCEEVIAEHEFQPLADGSFPHMKILK